MYDANDDNGTKSGNDTNEFIHLASKRLIKIPIISKPYTLRRLDLSENELDSLDGISQFTNLQRLNINNNVNLKSFPPEFKLLNKLHTLLMNSVEIDSFDNLPTSVTILSLSLPSLISDDYDDDELMVANTSKWNISFHLKKILESNKLKMLTIHEKQFKEILNNSQPTVNDIYFLKKLLEINWISITQNYPANQTGIEHMIKYNKKTIKDFIDSKLIELEDLKAKQPYDEDAFNAELNDLRRIYNKKQKLPSPPPPNDKNNNNNNNNNNSKAMYLSASTKLSDIVTMMMMNEN